MTFCQIHEGLCLWSKTLRADILQFDPAVNLHDVSGTIVTTGAQNGVIEAGLVEENNEVVRGVQRGVPALQHSPVGGDLSPSLRDADKEREKLSPHLKISRKLEKKMICVL